MQNSILYKITLCTFFLFTTSFSNAQNCLISNVFAEVHPCDNDGNFLVDITFDIDNPGGEGFTIRGNGQLYGDDFIYGQPFYTIGPLSGDCTTVYEFIIIDNEDNSCQSFTGFDETICCDKTDCLISAENIVLGDCDSTGYRNLMFNVDVSNSSASEFNLLFRDIPVMSFSYGNNPYSLSIPGTNYTRNFVIQDAVNEDCFTNIRVENDDCDAFEACEFLFSRLELDFECTSDSTYFAFANFEYNGSSDSLYLVVNNLSPELFSVNTNPVLLGEFVISNELFLYAIHDQNDIFCFTESEWNDAPDCSEFTNCNISRVFAEAQECNDNGFFFVDIEFQHEGTGDEGFEIRGNGVSYGDTFQYDQLFYTIGPIEGDCNTLYEFVIIDNANPNCSAFYEFDEVVCCDDVIECNISDIVIDSLICNNDGSYGLLLNFNYEGTTNDFFDVWADEEYVGFYAYEDLPIFIETFYPRDVEYDLIRICDNDNELCCTEFEFIGPDCDENETCQIFDVFAEAYTCDEDGNFLVDIAFESENIGDLGFTILGNGVVYGSDFVYGETFYTIGPLSGDCSTLYEFIVIDNADNACSNFTGFEEAICCDISDCAVEVFDVTLSSCDSLGNRVLTFDVEHVGITNLGFDILFEGAPIVNFDYGAGPYSITVPGSSDVENLILQDQENPTCQEEIIFENEDCGNYEDCDFLFSNIELIFECINEEVYEVQFNLDYDGSSTQLMLLFENNPPITFDVNSLPVSLGEFEISNELYTFAVHEIDNVFCYTNSEWNDAPDCSELAECDITNLIAEAYECDDDGNFLVDIAFESENVGDLGFTIRGNGVVYGDDFQYGETFYTIGPLTGDCSTIYEFIIIDNEDDGCNNFTGFDEPICCGDEMVCDIRDIELDSFSCNNDGTYSLVLDFIYEGNTNEFFDVWAGVEYVGFYRYTDLPIYIDTFYGRDVEYDFIKICDNDNDECCAEFEFIGPECDDIIDSVSERPIDQIEIYTKNKMLFVNSALRLKYSIALYNINGQLLSRNSAQGEFTQLLNVNDGVYLVKIQDLDSGEFVSKLIYL